MSPEPSHVASPANPVRAMDALAYPLRGGRLIEASAGTGKTWTIAALYLRLVLGHGGDAAFGRALMPADILVMTFTRAATRELSERIRSRLAGAARVLRGVQEPDAKDSFLVALRDSCEAGPAREQAAWRLALAAESMDDAAVHTIDAWCQRMLREHAFDSGALFDETLDADESRLQAQAARDYWRQQVYPLKPCDLERVLQVWSNVDALIDDAYALREFALPTEDADETLEHCIERSAGQLRQALTGLRAPWAQRAQDMQQWLDAQTAAANCDWDRRKLASRHYTGWLNTLAAWARDTGTESLVLSAAAEHRLSPAGLMQARKTAAPDIALPAHFEALQELLAALRALPQPAVAMRLHASAQIQARVRSLKAQSRSFGFHDMLVRLDAALHGTNGDALRERIVAQYPVAMIDEFQDTSPLQYRIFQRLYRPQDDDSATALLLIGDPKQSIYAFRGADIYSYLEARRATQGRHAMLATNFRATQALVEVVNDWFAHAEQHLLQGAFGFRAAPADTAAAVPPAPNPLPFVPVLAHGRLEQLVSADGPVPAMGLVHALQPGRAPAQRARFAARCAEQITGWLNDPQTGFQHADKPFQRLRPADIAVLVRSGTQAQAMQRALQRRGVASVYLSDKDSVLRSSEARDLLWWLQAVANPLDARRLRTALATASMGLPVAELERLLHDDHALEARSQQLQNLHAVWRSSGVLAMLRQSWHQFMLAARWLPEPGGERRLTNLLHLAELVQQASTTLDGEQALIRWLAAQLQEQRAAADEHVVRLESDADLVQIVTVHKSKGLEYPVVCLPFAASIPMRPRKRHNPVVALSDGQGARTTHLAVTEAQWEQIDAERLREDLRLLYVALTRARHALWLGVAAVGDAKAASTSLHRSALGHLLGGDTERSVQEWCQLLDQRARRQTHLQVSALDSGPVPCTALVARDEPPPLVPSPPYSAPFDRSWRTGSFSQLVQGLAAGAAPTELLPTSRMQLADDERALSHAPLDTVPADTLPSSVMADAGSVEHTGLADTADPAVWHRFARGATVGNFLHTQLEWLSGEDFALTADSPLQARLQRRCEQAGRASWASDVSQWLAAAVDTVLPPLGVALTGIHTRLPEMEFWLPVHQLDIHRLDALCRAHVLPGLNRPALRGHALHGMLTGFADLVFAHNGRYWVLDYKSNALGSDATAYDAAALAQAVVAHRYDVQAALYMLALHRLLRARLGDAYHAEQHLGGALFFFLRGIDGAQAGVSHIAPPMALLDALDAMLTGATTERAP